MASSGIDIPDEVVEKYHQLKKKGGGYKFMVLKISDDKKHVEIVKTRETKAEPEDTDYVKEIFDDLINEDRNTCLWAITEVNYSYKEKDSASLMDRSKVVLISW